MGVVGRPRHKTRSPSRLSSRKGKRLENVFAPLLIKLNGTQQYPIYLTTNNKKQQQRKSRNNCVSSERRRRCSQITPSFAKHSNSVGNGAEVSKKGISNPEKNKKNVFELAPKTRKTELLIVSEKPTENII